MNNIIKSKKGSITVFLGIVLMSMFLLTFTFIKETKHSCEVAYVNSVASVSGRSILSEYNSKLKDDYGIFAFSGLPPEISEKVLYYVNNSLDEKETLKIRGVESDTSDFELSNLNVFKKEIIEYSKYLIAKSLIEKDETADFIITGKQVIGEMRDGIIKNSSVINSLPSREISVNDNIISKFKENINGLESIFTTIGDELLLENYFFNVCGNGGKTYKKDTFFANEIEYLIAGKQSDYGNFLKVKRKIIMVRNLLNLLYIKSDPKMMAEIKSLALLMTPGPAAIGTELILMEGWALAEAHNDFKLLVNRKKVPIYKTKMNWAIDLESSINSNKNGFIDTKNKSGLNYKGYLKLLLHFVDSDTKLVRMMDLMQINLQGTKDKGFLIKAANTGFYFNLNVNGKNYEYEEKY
ncbi:MAG: DUF5702 domain-containing protein [Anaerovoracaceae bacterium]